MFIRLLLLLLLLFYYIKNHYRITPVDLRIQKELDADPKAIQQIEFVGQLKTVDGINTDKHNIYLS